MKLRGKKNWQNHVSEIIWLDWSVNSFQVENFFSRRKFLCQYQTRRQANTWPLLFLSQLFRYFLASTVAILVDIL